MSSSWSHRNRSVWTHVNYQMICRINTWPLDHISIYLQLFNCVKRVTVISSLTIQCKILNDENLNFHVCAPVVLYKAVWAWKCWNIISFWYSTCLNMTQGGGRLNPHHSRYMSQKRLPHSTSMAHYRYGAAAYRIQETAMCFELMGYTLLAQQWRVLP